MQLSEDRKLSRTHGVRKPPLHVFKTKTKQKNINNSNNKYPSRHYAQTLWMLKNATFGKKSMQAII